MQLDLSYRKHCKLGITMKRLMYADCRVVTKLNYNRTRLTKNLLVLQQNLVVNIYESTTIQVIIWKDGSKTSGKCNLRTHAAKGW